MQTVFRLLPLPFVGRSMSVQTLRSIPITETSSLLRSGPPLWVASVLSGYGPLVRLASHVPHEGPGHSLAMFMPEAPLTLSWS